MEKTLLSNVDLVAERFCKPETNMKKQQSRYKFNDPLIVPRVKNYLAENVDKTFVDVSQMARSLKERYREYNNRSESAFCQMVEAAYKVVLQSYGLDGASSTDGSEEDSDDLELLDDNNQVLNDQLLAMYKMQDKKGSKKDRNVEKTSELIDISSDDSNAEKAPKLPKLNDQVTITPHVPESLKQAKSLIPITNSTPIENDTLKSVAKSNERKRKPENSKNYQKRKIVDSMQKQTEVTFDDVGGISEILSQICDLVLHMRHPEVYRQLGVKAPRGALLHGPPGTGKTLLAHAISGKLKLPIIPVAGTELVGGVSGESEERIRGLFDRAIASAPCVLFIDEIDAICGNRLNAQKDMERRMVAQLLASIDSLSEKDSPVLVLAATNSPDSLDPALRRAGRLEQEIALGIPSLNTRKEIMCVICRKIALGEDIDFDILAQLTPGFVGADLQALVNKACTVAIKRVFHCLNAQKVLEDNQPNVDIVPETEKPVAEGDLIIPNGDSKADNGEDTNEKEKPAIENTNLSTNPQQHQDEQGAEIKAKSNGEGDAQIETPEIQKEPVPDIMPELKQNGAIETVNAVNKIVIDPIAELLSYMEEAQPYTAAQLSSMSVTQDDFLVALKTTKPCAIREGIATVPDVTWADIGSLKNVRKELQLAVIAPVKYPEHLKTLGLGVPSGILLCGPPGCGKTLLAKAVANEAGINFISVKGPELLNMYVGESEKAVRTCFQRARNSSPCVIFFDEFDSLCPKRSQGDNSGATRVVNQLLTEMDGIESREGVFVLAASNRPDIIDPAVLRPGRLDRIIYVGMPQYEDRVDILKAITKKRSRPPLSADVDFECIASVTDGYSGADLAGLVRQAATQTLTQFISEESNKEELCVTFEHFRKALLKTKPSVSSKEKAHYEKLRIKYAAGADEVPGVEEMETVSANEESMDTV